jgi:hypothetical protein
MCSQESSSSRIKETMGQESKDKRQWTKDDATKRRPHKETMLQRDHPTKQRPQPQPLFRFFNQSGASTSTRRAQAHTKYTSTRKIHMSLLPCAPPYTPAVQALGHIGLIVFVPTETLHEARVAVCTLRVACARASERARERARERERSSESPAREQVREKVREHVKGREAPSRLRERASQGERHSESLPTATATYTRGRSETDG